MIVGLLAKKRCGKDTTADYLVENYNFSKDTFASPIKQVCEILFNFSQEQLYGDQKEEIDQFWKVSPRTIMQYLGTDIFRHDINKIIPDCDGNFWVNCFKRRLDARIKENPTYKVVIADVRFQNEVDEIHKLGGIVIKIDRPGMESVDQHESEIGIDKINNYDILIVNDGTKEDLYKKINQIIKQEIKSI